MIRSGSTLQFQLAAELAERKGIGRRIEYVPEKDFAVAQERYGSESFQKVFKVHMCIEPIQKLFEKGQAKGIYSYRDIRDVAVSASKKFEMTFDDLIKKKWLDQAIQDYELWTKLPNVMISRYEDMTSDLRGEVMNIARHLGIHLSAAECEEIAQSYTLDRQRQRVKEVSSAHQAGGNSFDSQSLLHHNHINSGECGGWKTALNGMQIKILEDRYGAWLKKTGYSLSA